MAYTGKKLTLIFVLLAGIFACSKKGPGADDEDKGDVANRKAMLTHLADEIIIPTYSNFKAKMDVLSTKADAFSTNPTVASLQEFRAAWVAAYIDWQKVEVLDFGPAEMYALRGYFNIYPVSVTNVDANISSGNANLDFPTNFSSQGFPALDYLVNGLGDSDVQMLTFYTTASDASKRIAYLKSVIAKMNSRFNQVNSEWKGSYRETFINKTGIDASSSTSAVVNGFVRNYERSIRSGKFGIPSGAMLNGTVSPQSVEAYYKKDISLTLAKTAHQASVDFFNGKSVKSGAEGPALKTYLNSLPSNNNLASGIIGQFTATTQKLNAITTENLSSLVQNNNQVMQDMYAEMQKSVKQLKVDMTSAMSITISYTDNDGD